MCKGFKLFNLFFDPGHKKVDNAALLFGRKGSVLFHLVPFIKAATTAAGAGVLSHEYGVPSHGGLLFVIWNNFWGEAVSHEILGVAPYSVKPFFSNVILVILTKMEF